MDVILQLGDTYTLGKLRIIMGECRYPVANPAGDAYAFRQSSRKIAQKNILADG